MVIQRPIVSFQLCCREIALMERQRREADVKQKQALKGFLG